MIFSKITLLSIFNFYLIKFIRVITKGMKPQDFSKQLKEYSTEMDAIKHQAIISKPTKA